MLASTTQSAGKNKKSKLPTPEDYKALLNKHVVIAKRLDKETANWYKNQNKKNKADVDPTKFLAEKVSYYEHLKTSNYDLLKKLSSPYGKAYKLAREDKVGAPNSAFSSPIVVNDVLVNFFRNADLGQFPNGSRVQDVLNLMLKPSGGIPFGISSRSILASALALYAKKHKIYTLSRENNGLPIDKMNRQVLGADEYMLRTLGPLFDQLERTSAAKLQALGLRDGDEKPQNAKRIRKYYRVNDDGSRTRIWNDFEHVFDRRNFSYSSFQSLFSAGGIVDRSTLKRDPGAYPQVPVDFFERYVIDKESGVKYMTDISALKEESKTNPNALTVDTFNNVVRSTVAPGQQPSQGLVLRALLDGSHFLVASSSRGYDEKRPKQKSKKAKKAQ